MVVSFAQNWRGQTKESALKEEHKSEESTGSQHRVKRGRVGAIAMVKTVQMRMKKKTVTQKKKPKDPKKRKIVYMVMTMGEGRKYVRSGLQSPFITATRFETESALCR